MPHLTIVADITAKAGHIDLVRSELLKLIPVTRNEEGCVTYDLHQDNANPAHFLFYEVWSTRELWQAHMGAPHLADFIAATDGSLEGLTVHEMTGIG